MSAFFAFIENLKKRRKGFVRLAILLLVNAVVFAGITYRLANKQDRLAADQENLSAELVEKTEALERLTAAEARVAENASAVTEFWTDTVNTRVPRSDGSVGGDRSPRERDQRRQRQDRIRA